ILAAQAVVVAVTGATRAWGFPPAIPQVPAQQDLGDSVLTFLPGEAQGLPRLMRRLNPLSILMRHTPTTSAGAVARPASGPVASTLCPQQQALHEVWMRPSPGPAESEHSHPLRR